MEIFYKIKRKLKNDGVKATLQTCMQELLGIRNQQDQIDTLYYFLNKYIDPQKIPPTEDEDLRIMQICNAYLINYFDKICKKYNYDYWMDWGTLLGAVRHGGSIPWDDDTDVCMPRSDYDRFLKQIPLEFSQSGIDVKEADGRICISYRHLETGIWIDVFPADVYHCCSDVNDIKNSLEITLSEYKKRYYKLKHINEQNLQVIREECFSQYNCGEKSFYVLSLGACGFIKLYALNKEDIYPLKKIKFENFYFNAPNNCDKYLRTCYGDSYMNMPKSGVLHHGDGRAPLSTWAKTHGVDMFKIKDYLKKIAEDVSVD